jgi:signal transduction histidine kinase
MKALDRFQSLKLRFGFIIVAGVGTAVATVTLGRGLGLRWSLSALLGIAVALGLVQLVARGTTKPLREMAIAARAFAVGDYSRRVNTSARDEVGQLAQSFNQMAEELASVDRFRRDLVANASHELRTPIAVVRAVLENVVDGVQPASPETMQSLLGQVERLGRLVDQLLDLSRLESGTVPMQRRAVNLKRMLDESANAVRVRGHDVRVAVDVSDNDLAVDGDPDRLRQVVTNLVDNAIRHSPSDGEIRLRAYQSHGVSGTVDVVVEDDGPGVSAEDAQRIFDRFTRLDDARSANDGGAGLGLSIVKWIVDLHGGSVRVEPVHPKPVGSHIEPTEPSETAQPSETQTRGCRFVVTLKRSAPV